MIFDATTHGSADRQSPWLLTLIAVAIALAALLIVPAAAGAQRDYPNKPVRLIVAYAAGGVADVIARIVATPLGAELGQQFVIDNRPGAGGAIGTQQCAGATPDGYTLCMGSQSSIILNPMLFTSNHLTAVYLNKAFGLRIEHVPYKGGILAVQDVIAGQIPMAMDQISSSIAHVRRGALVAVLQSGVSRSSHLPDVSTFAETVFPKFRFDSFQALLGPAGMPPEVVKRLSTSITRILATPDVAKKFDAIGVVPVGNAPAEFSQQIREQVPIFRELMDMSGLKPE